MATWTWMTDMEDLDVRLSKHSIHLDLIKALIMGMVIVVLVVGVGFFATLISAI